MHKGRVKNIEALAETKFLSLYDAEYTNKKGNTKHWIIASRKNKESLRGQIFQGKEEKVDAVIIIAYHKDLDKLVILKQFRVPVNDYLYELPAGLIDEGEEIFDAVERELKEETGLKLVSINKDKSIRQVYASGGMTDESVALVYCLCQGQISTEYLEEDEDIEVMLVSQEEAKDIIESGQKIDVKTYLMLQSFARLGKDIVK